ncbi:uncharacterized protein METZ01_LOCUS51601 [marine metagenome]|uniref:Uncharacterized protein n=1 Tax=marine metagenome TaxID=408172 RepID=A0A381S921_9ZZZZ
MLPLVFEAVNEFRNRPDGPLSYGRNTIARDAMVQQLCGPFLSPLGQSVYNNLVSFG